MKKTTYILIGLVAAGILFAAFICTAMILTYRQNVTLFSTEGHGDDTTIELPAFSSLYIGLPSNGKIRFSATIKSCDTISSPILTISQEGADLMKISGDADSVALSITVTEEFMKAHDLATYTDINIPFSISIPANSRSLSVTGDGFGYIMLSGLSADELTYGGPAILDLESCRIGSMTFRCQNYGMTLFKSTVGKFRYEVNANTYSALHCHDGAFVDSTLLCPSFDGNRLDLRDFRTGSVELRPATDCGCIQVSYGPETISGALTTASTE